MVVKEHMECSCLSAECGKRTLVMKAVPVHISLQPKLFWTMAYRDGKNN